LTELMKHKYSMSDLQAREANDRITSAAAQVGLEYHLLDVKRGNTFNAHRLIHPAGTHGIADAMEERLMAAYFTESQPICDAATPQRLAAEVGLHSDEVAALLGADAFALDVRSDEQRARDLGANGVPLYLINEARMVVGAQPADSLLHALQQAWDNPSGR
jgi:predicted DsbA family dithiol-disulfide isomerase